MLENIRMSLHGIRTHKLRSFLTMLGVIIGIASIIAIVSIVTGTNRKLEKNLIGAGNNVARVCLEQDGFDYDFSYNPLPAGVPTVSDSVLEQIRALSGVEAVSRYTVREGSSEIYYLDAGLGGAYLYGVDSGYLETYRYSIVKGRAFSAAEYSDFSKVAMIDTAAAESLFESENPVGKTIEIQQEPFVIVGVYRDANAAETEYTTIEDYYRYGYDSAIGSVCIPEGTWPLICQFDEPQSLAIRTAETSQMNAAATDAANILNARLTSESLSYAPSNSRAITDGLNELSSSIHMMLIAIAALSLLVGGIGVMNIMLVSVTERTAEIGLKKALGAKRKVIIAQFLTESAVLTLIGGVLGVMVGILAAWIISYINQLQFAVSVPWMLIAVGFSVIIGLIFGAMPAYRAAKLDPIEALRRE